MPVGGAVEDGVVGDLCDDGDVHVALGVALGQRGVVAVSALGGERRGRGGGVGTGAGAGVHGGAVSGVRSAQATATGGAGRLASKPAHASILLKIQQNITNKRSGKLICNQSIKSIYLKYLVILFGKNPKL